MSIELFNNSPFKFNVDNYELYGTNVCAGEVAPKFCRPVKSGDFTRTQFKPCDLGNDFINNGRFKIAFDWTLGDGWTLDTAAERADRTASVIVSSMSQTIPGIELASASNPLTYEVTWVVNSFEDNASGNDLNIKIGGNLVRSVSDSTVGGPNQVFLDSFTVTSTTNSLLEFEGEANIDVRIGFVELRVAECAINQECANPGMTLNVPAWTLGGGWTQSGETIFISSASSGVLTNPLSGMLDVGALGRLQITLSSAPTGAGTCEVRVGGNVVTTFDSTTSAGLQTFYISRSEDDFLGIEFDAATLSVSIDECTFYNLSSPAALVQTRSGTNIQVADLSRSAGNLTWVTSNNTSQVQLNYEWLALNDDCYFFQIYDTTDLGSELVTNGNFATATDWTEGGNWAIGSGRAEHSGAAPSTLSQDIGVTDYTLYRVDFTIEDFDDIGSGATLTVKVGGATVKVLSAAGDNNGTYHIIHRVNTKTNDLIEFTISAAADFEVGVDDVSVKVAGGVAATEIACSECFQVNDWLDTAGCETTRLLTAVNTDNGFGFDYTNFTTMEQALRVFARFKNDTFEQIVYDAFLFNNNTVTTNFAQSRAAKLMKFDTHPPYIYDAVQIMSDHDTFKIDAVEFNKITEGVIPDYPPRHRMGTVELTYFKTSQPNRINDNC